MKAKFSFLSSFLLVCCIIEKGICGTKVNIEELRIKISDRSYADTSGKLRFDVRQGQTSCSTIRETFSKPKRNQEYFKNRNSGTFGSCYSAQFDPEESIEFRIISDSGNDAYIDSAGVKLRGEWMNWNGYQVKVNKHGEGNAWRYVPGLAPTCPYVINGVAGACNVDVLHFTFGSAHNTGAGSYGTMRTRLSSYSSGLGCGYNSQDISITSMLEDHGIRHLDLDTSYITASDDARTSNSYWEEGIVLVHKALYSRPLKRALHEINDFLGRNPHEVVLVRLKDYDEPYRTHISNALESEFSVITNTGLSPTSNPKLGDAVSNNRRLIVYIHADFGVHRNMHTLNQVETYRKQSSTTGCFAPSEHIDRFGGDNAARTRSNGVQLQVDWYYVWGLCLKDLAKLCNEGQFDKLVEINDEILRIYGKPVNIFMIDYVGLEDEAKKFKGIIENMNRKNVGLFG